VYFVKMSFRKDIRIIFLVDNIRFKRNYLKRQGPDSGVIGLAREKWVTALGQCGEKVG
jgi:hypothetical protein